MYNLLGADMPLAVRFFLAFLIVLGLIGVTAFVVRRFGSGKLGGAAVRGRQPRLAVIDHASVDTRRRLILVRRDNVEHLLMIGGPTDVLVEANIVRGAPAARDVLPSRQSAPETPARPLPLPEAESIGSWPLQPEPAGLMPPPVSAPPPRRAPRIEPAAEEPPAFSAPPPGPPPLPPEIRQNRQRDALAALADDLSANPVPPAPPLPAAPPVVPQMPPRARTAPPPRPPAIEPRAETRPAPRIPATVPGAEEPTADQNLAEMAQRLEAALRKPKANIEPRLAPAPENAADTESVVAPPPPSAPPPRAARTAETHPSRPDANGKEGKMYDSLEQEMASLLGRPPGKT
jgi:hypothetical protein